MVVHEFRQCCNIKIVGVQDGTTILPANMTWSPPRQNNRAIESLVRCGRPPVALHRRQRAGGAIPDAHANCH